MVNQLQEERDALARELRGRHCGTSKGQTEAFSNPRRRHNPSHAHSHSRRLDAGSPRRLAGCDEWRQLRQGSRVDVHDVERSRKVGRHDRRHGTVTNVHRHSRYGLRGVRVGEASVRVSSVDIQELEAPPMHLSILTRNLCCMRAERFRCHILTFPQSQIRMMHSVRRAVLDRGGQ